MYTVLYIVISLILNTIVIPCIIHQCMYSLCISLVVLHNDVVHDVMCLAQSHPPVPLMSGHLSCTDTFAWSQGCPPIAGTTVYTLLKVVSYYDLSVLAMSVMGFQKKEVWYAASALSKYILDFWNLFNFAKRLNRVSFSLGADIEVSKKLRAIAGEVRHI